MNRKLMALSIFAAVVFGWLIATFVWVFFRVHDRVDIHVEPHGQPFTCTCVVEGGK